jgi:hypothetical protein
VPSLFFFDYILFLIEHKRTPDTHVSCQFQNRFFISPSASLHVYKYWFIQSSMNNNSAIVLDSTEKKNGVTFFLSCLCSFVVVALLLLHNDALWGAWRIS